MPRICQPIYEKILSSAVVIIASIDDIMSRTYNEACQPLSQKPSRHESSISCKKAQARHLITIPLRLHGIISRNIFMIWNEMN